jgi:hypothetical protein
MARNQLAALVADADLAEDPVESLKENDSSEDEVIVKKRKKKDLKKEKKRLKKLKKEKISIKSPAQSASNSDEVDESAGCSSEHSSFPSRVRTGEENTSRKRIREEAESLQDEEDNPDESRKEMQELQTLLDASTYKKQRVDELNSNDVVNDNDVVDLGGTEDDGSEMDEVDLPASIMGPLSEVQESMRMAFTGLQDLQEALENRERRMRRLERANAILKRKLKLMGRANNSASTKDGTSESRIDAQEIQCEACGQFVREDHVQKHHGGVESKCKCCVHHSGIFYAVEELPMRELDSDSDSYGMWNCCEAEERDAIGCERGCHHLF